MLPVASRKLLWKDSAFLLLSNKLRNLWGDGSIKLFFSLPSQGPCTKATAVISTDDLNGIISLPGAYINETSGNQLQFQVSAACINKNSATLYYFLSSFFYKLCLTEDVFCSQIKYMFRCNLLHLKLQINFCTWKWKERRFQQNGDTNKLYKAVVHYLCFFCAICTYLYHIKITDGGHETCGRAQKSLQQASPCQLSPVPGCDGCWDHSPRPCWSTGTTGMPEAPVRLLLYPGKCICEFSRNRLLISPCMLVHNHIRF